MICATNQQNNFIILIQLFIRVNEEGRCRDDAKFRKISKLVFAKLRNLVCGSSVSAGERAIGVWSYS